jgi:CBS domain-containing protein
MQARDVMTKAVVTVKPETPIGKIAALLLEKRISGVPVVDETGAVVGMVTEGDLLKSNAPDREKRREWWLTLLAEGEGLAKAFLSTISNNQRTAREIMSAPVVTVSDDTDIAEIGKLFATLQIKRVPVIREGRLKGIVSRADLIRVVASQHTEQPQEEGMFGWTLRFDPFSSQAKTPAKAVKKEALAEKDELSASSFRHLVYDAVTKKAHQEESQKHAIEEQRKAKMKELVDHHLTDEHWRGVLHQARIAAERGEWEIMVLQFPHELCSDSGRAINVAEPDWPCTLRGEAAETYLRFERDLKPRGFHLIAKVMGFPGGYIGDIGLFLHWGGAKES